MKKIPIISLLVLVVLFLTSCGGNSAKLNGKSAGDNIDWHVDGDVLYLNGAGNMASRKSFNDYPWSDIDCQRITRIEICDGITGIGAHAFEGFTSVQYISLPDSIVHIEPYAFKDVPLYSIDLPKNIEYIGEGAFFNSNLKRIFIPASVNYIGNDAFRIGWSPSNVCYAGSLNEWEAIKIGKVNDILESVIHFNSPDSRKKNFAPLNIEGNACGDNATWSIEDDKLVISGSGDIWDFHDEEAVPWYTQRYDLDEIEISDSITGIGDYSLYGIASIIKVPENVTFIGDEAINEGIIMLPASLKFIGSGNFGLNPESIYYSGSEDSWKNIEISKNNDSINDYTILFNYNPEHFYARPYDRAPDTITSGYCGDNATWSYDSDNQILTISGTGQIWDQISDKPWKYLTMRKVVIEEGIIGVGDYAFSDCSVQSVSLPDSLLYIGENAFNWTLLNSVTIPDNVRYIGDYAFHAYYSGGSNYAAVRTVHIPKSVCYIGVNAFDTNVHTFTVDANNPCFVAHENVLFSKDMTHLYCFYDSKGSAYYSIPYGVKTIGHEAFRYRWSNLKGIDIPDTVTRIGSSAFSNCQNVKEFDLPEGLEVISKYAFTMCVDITEIDIPNSVTYIGEGAFQQCSSMENVKISNNISVIQDSTFQFCYELENVSIPEGVTVMENRAFSDCERLDTVKLPSTLKSIGYDVFDGTNIEFAYYSGDSDGWDKVKVGSGNDTLVDSIIYNY